MRKFLLSFCVLFLFLGFNAALASSSPDFMSIEKTAQIQNQISKIGFNLLNSNEITQRAVFSFNKKDTVNAVTKYSNREIILYKGLYLRLNSDDEIAAVLAHEISHSVDSYDGIFRGFFSHFTQSFASKKYEYKADKRAIDYMVNAGYNPVAMIVVMNKAFPQTRYDWCSTHPLSSRRMMEVYEYIYKKYPEYLVNNSYKNDIFYQNFLLTSKQNRAKFQKKVQSNSKSSVNYL